MNVLIGCEESQTVLKEMLKKGANAYSCDLQPCSGGVPERHLILDIFDALAFAAWDLVILHPPCTAIAVSGNAHYGEGAQTRRQNKRRTMDPETLGRRDFSLRKSGFRKPGWDFKPIRRFPVATLRTTLAVRTRRN